MKNLKLKSIFCSFILQLIIFSQCLISINSDDVYEINEAVLGNENYKKAEFEGYEKKLNYYFKYNVEKVPISRISAFRFEFDQFDIQSKERNKVYCTFVDSDTTDEDLIEAVRLIDNTTTSCVGAFKESGFYDGIIKHDESKKKLVIYLVALGNFNFTARVYLRINEKNLSVNEQTIMEDESYSLVPFTIIISHFREQASKILFYSYTRELQMYYKEENTPYPERLFFGNILSVYTNPNMVRQKYKNADTMVLLTKNFEQEDMIGEQYLFQVKFFASNYLLDYYMSNNLEGRSKNTPLAINMTECENPYYVILNYNKPEKQISLYIDEIYGKIKSLAVAPKLTRASWEQMIENDMENIEISTKKYILPKDSSSHIDVYKIECEVPLLLNFYYIDESASIPELDFGHVAITTLKPYTIISLPFAQGISLPELTVEVFNPVTLPSVVVNDGQNEKMITKNSLIRTILLSTNKPIILKERNGDSDTRVIIKVGYPTSSSSWSPIPESDYVLYNSQLNMYVFYFPSNEDKLNYTYALLETSGTNSEDNVKYCYGTNIGSAILPSNENCYRVSELNSYTIKIINPFVMYKDYDISENLNYYVSLRPTSKNDRFEIKANLVSYDTKERNYERIGKNIVLNNGLGSTILTSPEEKDEYISVQIYSCDKSKLNFGIFNGYDNSQIVSDQEIPAGKENYYYKFKNIFFETEVKLTGNNGDKVFVKHTGISENYTPKIKNSFPLSFNEELNQLIIQNPLETSERMRYTVLVGKSGELSNKGITLCTFEEIKEKIDYTQTFVSFSDKNTLNINFNKIGLVKGNTFEAIALIEQEPNSRLSFLTEIFQGKVGEITQKTIIEIKNIFNDEYIYTSQSVQSDQMSFYFSYLPTETFDVPVGAFRIELDQDASGEFSKAYCAFVDENDDANTMVEAVEDIISQFNSYCIGGKSRTNERIYNYFFKYSYTKETTPKPRRLVIKLNNYNANGGFRIYVKKTDNIYIEQTDFSEEREYGKQEEYKNSIIPYIIDLDRIRGNGTDIDDYISKILFYSQHLEMQMYYLDSNEERNDPILLFTGNIMLVYTNLALAEQKYHATKLILLSENLNGQEHSAIGNQFRFHTKMFKSTDQIEYFLSNSPTGRPLNRPLSIEMNTCTSSNNKYYFILNYNTPQDEDILLYIDLVFGSMKRARTIREINNQKWGVFIENDLEDINDYIYSLKTISQHIDVVEIECNTPLLINIYYNYKESDPYSDEDIVVKNLEPKETYSFTRYSTYGKYYYTLSTFNPKENPDITFSFDNINIHEIKENSLQIGFLLNIPYTIYLFNRGESSTRIIFKLGYNAESDWIDEKENIQGTLFSSGRDYIYKFPASSNKKNFTNVTLNIKPMRKDSEEIFENVKFCYSTSIGIPIDITPENCYRTGANIPYSLTFINPLIAPKNYKSYSDFYYVTISPYTPNEYISLEITENKYDTNERNNEGINKIIKLEESMKSTILSIPQIITNTKIVVQLEACKAQLRQINYVNKNAYTEDVISTGTTTSDDRFYYYEISNNLMETKLELSGSPNDLVFVKHTGITDYSIVLQSYYATFDREENTVNIIKPIKDESFRVTVLVGQKGDFDEYNLCTFAEKAESEYSKLADYASTFTSVTSNSIAHYIDFRSFSYKEGDEFDLLVYAVQMENSKLEILYNVITGKVGEIKGITQITGIIDSNCVTQDFIQNRTSNYLFYDFPRQPTGNVASLKIKNEEGGMKVNKVGCVFVETPITDAEMISKVNNAIKDGNSACIGQTNNDQNGFDALISAIDTSLGKKMRLVIQVIYGIGEEEKKEKFSEEGSKLSIYLRINGLKVSSESSQYNEKEDLTLIPYVLDLEEIRESQAEYISKVMLYSSTREMQMYYLGTSGAPTELFSGNIMLVYTNKDVIEEKYQGAKIMILLTNSLSKTGTPVLDEQFKFKTYFFKSDNTMQYYVSANPEGRLLNNPTGLEMPSCDVPYYYILNYHETEGDRILHIDNIFGEINTIKIANQLNKNDWYELVNSMAEISGNEFYIEGQNRYHIDVIEVTCKLPTLINIYYTDQDNPKISDLDQGDISIIELGPDESQKLSFKSFLEGEFIYSFNVFVENNKPNILISFENEEEMKITKNGLFTKNSIKNYNYINIQNKELSGSMKTKVIFKFGYNIESIFTKIQNNVYNLQTIDRTDNLFAYKFNTGDDRLNTTYINFTVSTYSDNVKFCYITNLGAFIDPSLQNCYRVGKQNSYTIKVLNPDLMYKNYYIGEDQNSIIDYYVAFRTEDKNLNITITPTLNNYTTNYRNIENYGNSITFIESGSTILTSPKDKKFLFVQMELCTNDINIMYEFHNAYNSSNLNVNGEIIVGNKNYYINIQNILLDTELILKTNEKKSPKIFVRHTGVDSEYRPVVNDIKINFDKKSNLTFNQPIENDEFTYSIYLDKRGNLRKQGFTLCSFVEISKLAHYTQTIKSAEELVSVNLDFNSTILKGYETFDLLILADNGKMMVLSDIFEGYKIKEEDDGGDDEDNKGDNKEPSSNLALVIILVILAVLLVVGALLAFILLRRYKLRPNREKLDAKETSLADVDNKNEPMMTSSAAVPNDQ